MPADVVEVDFEARRRSRMPLSEQAEEIATQLDELAEQVEGHNAWLSNQLKLSNGRVGALERALARERRASFPFRDDEVLDALRAVFAGAPVAASAVAATLYGREATYSACVRVGLALHRLRATGHVEAAVPSTRRVATRWAPIAPADTSE